MQQLNNNTRLDHCPFCQSTNIRQRGKLGYRGNVIFCTHSIEIVYLPELWKCQQCYSGFVQHILNAETTKILYSTGQSCNRWSRLAFDQSKTRDVVNTMANIFRNKGRVLDVGCNTGELLDFAHGIGCKTSGVEFSSASREILVDKGHNAYPTLGEVPNKYDIITAFDLIEHLYDISAFFEGCREKLTDKGRLVILTGNIASLSAVLSGTRWWYAQYPEHIVFPSKKYFSEYSGFRIEKWMPTYASKGYQKSICKMGLVLLKSMLRGNSYTGLPSLGPDHILVVLSK